MSIPRLQSGKIERHKQAIVKYQEYENSKQNKVKLNDMIKGSKTIPMVPKPGQFLCVATDKPLDQMGFLEIPLYQLLDETKSFTELKQASMERQRQKILSQSQPKRQQVYNPAVLKLKKAGKEETEEMEEDTQIFQEELGVDPMAKPQFTTNLRQIVRKQHKQLLSPTRTVLKDALEQKMEIQQSNKTLDKLPPLAQRNIQSATSIRPSRPISAKYILKALKLERTTEAFEMAKGIQATQKVEKRELSAQAKQRNFYSPANPDGAEIKHIMGYQTINLTSKDFIQTYDEEYHAERERKQLEKHFKTSAVDPRLQSPFIRTDTDAQRKIQQEQNDKGELELTKKRKAMFMSEPLDGNGRFLPLDFYYIEEEYGAALITKYSDENGKCLAQSKWFDTKGEFNWEPCEVVKYVEENDKYEVQWFRNGKRKQVTRVNLKFDLEDQQEFQNQLVVAEHYRKQSEVFIKYNYMIDQMSEETSLINEESLHRIQLFAMGCLFKMGTLRDPISFARMEPAIKYNFKRSLIPQMIVGRSLAELYQGHKYKPPQINAVLDEIRKLFVRTNHQITFDYTLPFSEEKNNLFKGFLPDQMMQTPNQRKTEPALYPSYGIGVHKFLELYEHIRQNLHQAEPRKLLTLQHTQTTLLNFEDHYLFQHEFQQPVTLDNLQYLQRHRLLDSIRDFKSRMYDVHFEIMDMVEQEVKLLKRLEEEKLRVIVLEAERRQLLEQDLQSETLTLLKQFQKLINTRFERAGRALWERSIEMYISILERVSTTFDRINGESSAIITSEQVHKYAWDLEFTPFTNELLLQVSINDKIELEPTADQWQLQLTTTISDALKDLTNIQAMRTREIGSAREDQLVHVFDDMSDTNQSKQRFMRLLARMLQMLQVYFAKLQEFSFLMKYNVEDKLKKSNYEDFSRELNKLVAAKEGINKYMFKRRLRVGIFWLDCEKYLQRCLQRVDECSSQLYTLLIKKIEKENSKIEKDISGTMERLKESPKNIEELHALRVYARDQLPEELKQISVKINKVMEKMTLTERMHYEISYDDFAKSWSIYGMPLKLLRRQDKCLKRLQNEEKGFQEDLMVQQGELHGEITVLQKELDILMMEHNLNQILEIAKKFTELGERIDRAQHDGEIVNRREQMLKWKVTDYQEIVKIKQLFVPYSRVWTLANDFNFKVDSCLSGGALGSIKREELTSDVLDSWTELFKLEKTTFKIVPHMLTVIQHVRKQYESVKPYLPVINDLLNPALKKEHWKRLKEIIKGEIDDDLNVKFDSIRDSVMENREEIRDISEKASKEMGFEKTINKMKSEWRTIKFEMTMFRDTGTYILKGIEPIFDKLDEDIAKTMSISSSPYIKFLERDVKAWMQNLFRVQETIEIWCKVQRSWQYLQPIFFSEDIIREMPKEGNRYQQVDKLWRYIMQSTHLQPLVMEACTQARIKENFVSMFEQLDKVIKGLNEFLNKKRQAFPRFYFLSNEELLQILAQAREPRAVQRHLNKCFEGIDLLTFLETEVASEQPKPEPKVDAFSATSKVVEEPKPAPVSKFQLTITEMFSQDRELVPLITHINPLDKELNVRGVEEWLFEVQQGMKSTLKDMLPKCIIACSKTPLEVTVRQLPAQLLICSYETIFTGQTTDAILQQHAKRDALAKHESWVQSQLLTTVRLLREGQWNKREVQTLGVLVVVQVKQKDVATELMEKEVSSVDNFDWMAQMRYYVGKKDEIDVRILHTQRVYGYEYLGNQSRLVITPLTDRCYRTLMASLHMNLGGAPEGPAGTGKTETTKDLSKAMAKHCVVFNCSDQLDYLAMGKFFKGLVSCGSWACFDEFNRIELEVLSVIAQQILTIQTAIIRESLSKVPIRTFMFEGVQLNLDSSAAIFITMNPGYAGRSELPDNLKALFRSVAMMIPNYAMITEISLYSYGFTKARQLSVKITTSLKLASEQLSTQSHYDFGMRAVKAIILAAGQLKRTSGDEEEEILVLRAIEDCNLPKFTVKDVPLFQAIISDLFPTTKPQERQYGYLGEAIKQVIEQKHLTFSERFYTKVIQLYETINVRHGLMVVGGTISGKTSILHTLADSLPTESVLQQEHQHRQQLLAEQDEPMQQSNPGQQAHPSDPAHTAHPIQTPQSFKPSPESKVHIYPLNPKSITPRLLYGDVDEATNEWQDGITAIIFRECLEEQQGKRWVVFDGPVDALWIENMNTVLDDNKKLCLTNGETIKLTDAMRIIFEVEDLMEASPATVSRCGMVYLEPQEIGWRALITPWFASLTPNFRTEHHEQLFKTLYRTLLDHAFEFVESHNLKLVYQLSKEWMGLSCLRLFYAFILKSKSVRQWLIELEMEAEKELARQKALEMEGKAPAPVKKFVLGDKERTEFVGHFLVAIVWSLGSLIDEDRRRVFSEWLSSEIKLIVEKESLGKVGKELLVPPDSTLYELFFDGERRNWNLWNNKPEFRIARDTAFHDIYVPTTDSQRNHGLLKQLLMHDYPVLFYGKTGTGKTMVVKRFLLNEVDTNAYVPTITAFSANTSCLQVLDVLEQKLEKQKRRKGVYGPLIGTTNLIFIDDLNMPQKELYGAQPPLELVRQWFSQGGWYDRKSLECKQIIDIVFCGAMGLGRPAVSNRLLRHFSLIYVPEMDHQTLKVIVQKICDWGFDEYVDKVKFAAKNLPAICYSVYSKVGATFLPLPKKSHYLFNMRDLMKVVQGVIRVPASKYDAVGDSKTSLLRLWVHESMRVYSDRLVDSDDQQQFRDILNETLDLEFALHLDQVLNTGDEPLRPKSMLYGNFLEVHSVARQYQELTNISKLTELIREYVGEFNQFYPKRAIDLVLFEDAIQFLCKVNRIISQPFGNTLLVGLGGTGCRTLSRLAAFMQDYLIGEPEVNDTIEWYDFLRELLKNVGLKGKDSIFLLSDAQIINEKFLEDLNNILNIGEIPNLYNVDDKENLLSDLKDEADKEKLSLSPLQLWEYFVKRCKMNLHVVLYLSPVGDKLKTRIRNFPSLVSCTSTIWVQPWSQAALKEVAMHYLQDGQMVDQTEAIANVCVGLHQSVQDETAVYARDAGKYYYVTPLSYMKLLSTFEKVFETKRDATQLQRQTYLNGVRMLDECAVAVSNMAKELENLQPVLVLKTQETEDIMRHVEIETGVAEKQRIAVQADEVTTKAKADVAGQIQAKCKERLSEAEPQLEEALNALKTLKVSDFVEMKSFQNPPKLIRLTMDAVCIMMERKPKRAADGSDDYWEEAKKLLADPGRFIKTLEKYNRNNIPEKVIQRMAAFLSTNKQFTPQTIAKASQAAEGLCKWVVAIYNYYHVYKAIQPLREDLEKANATLREAQDDLSKKQAQLALVEQKCQELRDRFENANFQKQKLKAQITDCEIKMRRALELTGGLSGEKGRWKETAERLQVQMEGLLGDMLLAVGYLSYMGAFTAAYRTKILEQKWAPLVKQQHLPSSAVFSLVECLSSQLEVQEWILNGLPLDDVSRENAIIMKSADSYPLIIDPQGQASKFIIRQEKRGSSVDSFISCKIEKRFPQVLEHALRTGKALMVQGIGQSLEIVLDAVLMKQYQIIDNKPIVTIAGNSVEVHPSFRLYLITSLPNPHYSPSILTKVTLINFTITPEALKDQMTSILVREEEPQLEEEKLRIMNDNNDYKLKMASIEANILRMISATDGAKMLDDEKLVQSLSESKVTSEEISLRLKEAKVTEERIYQNRLNYDSLSRFASNLYFTLLQLSALDPMYQFSLEFYVRIAKKAIRSAEKPPIKNIKQRTVFIGENLKRVVFFEVSRSIFVKDKNLFAFMLLITWLDSNGLIDKLELQFLLNGLAMGPIETYPNPSPEQFSPMQWSTLNNLCSLNGFKNLCADISENTAGWVDYLSDPIYVDVPPEFQGLSGFSRLLIIRAARPDLFGKCMRELITQQLGSYFVQNLLVPLDNSFQDSSITIPLIYVLQPGDDPQEEVKKYSQEKGRILTFVSLGKGQGEAAERTILESLGAGTWVILQNCHLAVSWLPRLEALLESITQELLKKDKERDIKVNSEFRLWLTTMSTDRFPQSLLMEGVKITKDPPRGVKANLQQIYQNQGSSKPEKAFYATCANRTGEWKQLFLGLCYFHAVVRERRRYGPVGWNILYDFNDSDFRISIRQLKQMLTDYEEIPFRALNFLTGECYYGGKVTDDWDRRVLKEMLGSFYRMDIFYDNYKFSSVQEYHIPDVSVLESLDDATEFISQLPEVSTPELFGLHPNAAITQAYLETSNLISSLVQVGMVDGGGGGQGLDKTAIMLERAKELLASLPAQFDMVAVNAKYRIDYFESMNTVLIQELLRYNNLLSVLVNSLRDLIKAAQGLVVMSQELDRIGEAILNNMLPASWKAKSYPSLKPLVNYWSDLNTRIEMFRKWIAEGPPQVFWVSGFYFTQSFFTGVLQNYARARAVPIDQLSFGFRVLNDSPTDPPETGVYIEGLYLEAASWNKVNSSLDEALPNQIYQLMPTIWLIPQKSAEAQAQDSVYICPVYKTTERKGTLSTTGHSTNFILPVTLRTERDPSHWVKRGTALISQLNE